MTMKTFLLALFAAVLLFGCRTATLEPGGVYAPTNAAGVVIYNDLALALTDASYKLAYEAILIPLKFERDNRATIFALDYATGLAVKHNLDEVRRTVWALDQRWAVARRAYRANPTPAGMSVMKTILWEIQRIIPVAQSQLEPVNEKLR